MARVPSSAVAAAGLVGGYAVARWTGKRRLGGVVLGAAGLAAGREWHRRAGAPAAAGLGALYLAGFAGAHPLAKKVGAWPAVLGAAAAVATASWFAADARCPRAGGSGHSGHSGHSGGAAHPVRSSRGYAPSARDTE